MFSRLLALPESPIYDTIAGLVLHALGRLPAVGEQVVVEARVDRTPDDAREAVLAPVTVSVLALDRRRIDRVGLTVSPAPRPDDADRAGPDE